MKLVSHIDGFSRALWYIYFFTSNVYKEFGAWIVHHQLLLCVMWLHRERFHWRAMACLCSSDNLPCILHLATSVLISLSVQCMSQRNCCRYHKQNFVMFVRKLTLQGDIPQLYLQDWSLCAVKDPPFCHFLSIRWVVCYVIQHNIVHYPW